MSNTQELELWCVDLGASGGALRAIEQRTPRICTDGHARAAKIPDQHRREQWLAAHVALRLLIERIAGERWRRVTFARGERGKPYLPDAPIAFSLSHAGGLALIGIAREGAIGVDVEQARRVRIDAARRARIVEAGNALGGTGAPAGGETEFLQAWVRLEALAKADGCGIGRLLTALGILGAGKQAAATQSMSERVAAFVAGAPARQVRDVPIGPGIYGAAAYGGLREPPVLRWLPVEQEALEKLAL